MAGPELRAGTRALLLAGLAAAVGAGCGRGSERPAATPGGPEAGEEVNVAYGTQRKDAVTGAVTSLGADQAKDKQAQSVEELMRGRFAGVQVVRLPSGGIAVRIRGEGSILGSNEPLYIVDGVPVSTRPGVGLVDVDPLDIERIDVLKDLASTAIYGQRGANGVVLITTKRAR